MQNQASHKRGNASARTTISGTYIESSTSAAGSNVDPAVVPLPSDNSRQGSGRGEQRPGTKRARAVHNNIPSAQVAQDFLGFALLKRLEWVLERNGVPRSSPTFRGIVDQVGIRLPGLVSAYETLRYSAVGAGLPIPSAARLPPTLAGYATDLAHAAEGGRLPTLPLSASRTEQATASVDYPAHKRSRISGMKELAGAASLSADGPHPGHFAAAASRVTGGSGSTSSASTGAGTQLTARQLYTEEGDQEYKAMQAGQGGGDKHEHEHEHEHEEDYDYDYDYSGASSPTGSRMGESTSRSIPAAVPWVCPFCDKTILRKGVGPRARHLGQVHAGRVGPKVEQAFAQANMLNQYHAYASGRKADVSLGIPASDTVRSRLGSNLLKMYEDAVLLQIQDPGNYPDLVQLLRMADLIDRRSGGMPLLYSISRARPSGRLAYQELGWDWAVGHLRQHTGMAKPGSSSAAASQGMQGQGQGQGQQQQQGQQASVVSAGAMHAGSGTTGAAGVPSSGLTSYSSSSAVAPSSGAPNGAFPMGMGLTMAHPATSQGIPGAGSHVHGIEGRAAAAAAAAAAARAYHYQHS